MDTTVLASPASLSAGRSPRALSKWDIWVLLFPLLAMSPMLLLQWQQLMSRPERQFFPFLILIAMYFPLRSIFRSGRGAAELLVPIWRTRFAMGALGAAVLIYALGVVFFSPWLAHLAAILVFIAWALVRCVEAPWSSVMAWAGLLTVTLPLPLNYDLGLIAWLQSFSSWACSVALDGLNVPHLRLANVIEVRGRQLFVEEACSGIGSIYALLAAAALLVLISGRSMLVSVLTLASVPIWAMLGNFARLLTIALAQHYYERDLSHGMDHEILGLSTFALAALGLWMTEWLLASVLEPIPPTAPEFGFLFQTINAVVSWPNPDPFANAVDHEGESPAERAEREEIDRIAAAEREAAIVRVRPWEIKPVRIFARCATALALLASIPPAIVVARGSSTEAFSFNLPQFSDSELEKFPDKDSMPKQLGDEKLGLWELARFRTEKRSTASFFGEHSRIWEYRRGHDAFFVSMDFPFRGPHDLEVCYSSSGWKLDAIEDRGTDPDSWAWREVVMSNDFGSKAFVCYAMLTEKGEPFDNDVESVKQLSIVHRLAPSRASQIRVFQPVCYQVQILCESGTKLTEAEQEDIRSCFLKTRGVILDQIAKGSDEQ